MVVILGAGLAGLSAASHLAGRDVLVLEQDAEVGGLCRSFRENGFTFDCTGHLLHLRDPELRRWVNELLPGGWLQLSRLASIHSHGALTPYPFQANTAGLPVPVRLDCLLGFIETLRRPARGAPPPDFPADPALPFLKEPAAQEPPDFGTWIRDTFGEGFARHFFVPYNTKLWRRDPSEMTSDWVSWSIPRPELADVLRGALTTADKRFGYNPDFLYPRAGGIDALPRAIAARLAPGVVRTGTRVASLDAGRRTIRTADGESFEGPCVLSSLPLPVLAGLTTDLPPALAEASRRLRHVSVRAINLGVRGPPRHPRSQWIYFPEPDVPFHRLGFPTELTPAMAPPGHHQITAEISFRPEAPPPPEQSLEQTLQALLRLGMLASRDDVVHVHRLDIPTAYVVFDRDRRRVLPELQRWYVQRGVVPLGRYGAWDYLAMEDCLGHGRDVARWIARTGA